MKVKLTDDALKSVTPNELNPHPKALSPRLQTASCNALVLTTYIDASTRLILYQLARDVLAGASRRWRHLAVVLPIATRRVCIACRGRRVRESRVANQSCSLPCRRGLVRPVQCSAYLCRREAHNLNPLEHTSYYNYHYKTEHFAHTVRVRCNSHSKQ